MLPRRDELRIRYDSWAAQALERERDPQNHDLVRRYIRRHHHRRMNAMDEVARGTFLRAKQEGAVAIDLLNWLTDQEISLPNATQTSLDLWQAEGRTTRRIAERLLKWAIKTKTAPSTRSPQS